VTSSDARQLKSALGNACAVRDRLGWTAPRRASPWIQPRLAYLNLRKTPTVTATAERVVFWVEITPTLK